MNYVDFRSQAKRKLPVEVYIARFKDASQTMYLLRSIIEHQHSSIPQGVLSVSCIGIKFALIVCLNPIVIPNILFRKKERNRNQIFQKHSLFLPSKVFQVIVV